MKVLVNRADMNRRCAESRRKLFRSSYSPSWPSPLLPSSKENPIEWRMRIGEPWRFLCLSVVDLLLGSCGASGPIVELDPPRLEVQASSPGETGSVS
jgi:hypothetical protein